MLLKIEELLASLRRKTLQTIDLTGAIVQDMSGQRKLTVNHHVVVTMPKQTICSIEVLPTAEVVTSDNSSQVKLWQFTQGTLRETPIPLVRAKAIDTFMNDCHAAKHSQSKKIHQLSNGIIVQAEYVENKSYGLRDGTKAQDWFISFNNGNAPIKLNSYQYNPSQLVTCNVQLFTVDLGVVAVSHYTNYDRAKAIKLILILNDGTHYIVSDEAPKDDSMRHSEIMTSGIGAIESIADHVMVVYQKEKRCELKLINSHGRSRTVIAAPPVGSYVTKIDPLTRLDNGLIATVFFYSNFASEIKLFDSLGVCQRIVPIVSPRGYHLQNVKLFPLNKGNFAVICQYYQEQQSEYQYKLLLISDSKSSVAEIQLLVSVFPTQSVYNEQFLVYGESDNIFVIDHSTGKQRGILQEHFAEIAQLKFLSSTCLASISKDKTLKIWDLESLKCIETRDNVDNLVVLPEGQLVMSNNRYTATGPVAELIFYNSFIAYRPAQAMDLQAIFTLLTNDTTVQECKMGQLALADEGALQVAQLLRTNRHLKRIDLSSNQITDKGAKYLLAALKVNSTLTALELKGNEITAFVIASINARLAKNSALRTPVANQLKDIAPQVDISPDYTCPITHRIMCDPVSAADGETYEREAITEWLQAHNTSPVHGDKLEHKHLIPNNRIRSQISTFLDANPALKVSSELYLQKSLQEQCVKLIAAVNHKELEQLLHREPRLVTTSWDTQPNLLQFAAVNSLPLLKSLLKLLGTGLKNHPYVQCDGGTDLFQSAAKHLDLEGATLVRTALQWNLADDEDQLFIAIQHKNVAVIAICLALGASVDTVNFAGETPFVVAKTVGHTATLDLLTSKGASDISLIALPNTVATNASGAFTSLNSNHHPLSNSLPPSESPSIPFSTVLKLLVTQSDIIQKQQLALKQLQLAQTQRDHYLQQYYADLRQSLIEATQLIEKSNHVIAEWHPNIDSLVSDWKKRSETLLKYAPTAQALAIDLPDTTDLETLTKQLATQMNDNTQIVPVALPTSGGRNAYGGTIFRTPTAGVAAPPTDQPTVAAVHTTATTSTSSASATVDISSTSSAAIFDDALKAPGQF